MTEYFDHSGISRSYYTVLGVEPNAADVEIKQAYKDRLLGTHPDKFRGDNVPTVVYEISTIQLAYQTLIDPTKRKEYDESLLKSVQREGFNITGDGLDIFNLSEFEEVELDDMVNWYKNCPRCTTQKGISLLEDDLIDNGTADNAGGFDIIVQCSSCSLWIRVKYYEE